VIFNWLFGGRETKMVFKKGHKQHLTSKRMKGKKHSEETKNKIKMANKGRIFSGEIK